MGLAAPARKGTELCSSHRALKDLRQSLGVPQWKSTEVARRPHAFTMLPSPAVSMVSGVLRNGGELPGSQYPPRASLAHVGSAYPDLQGSV